MDGRADSSLAAGIDHLMTAPPRQAISETSALFLPDDAVPILVTTEKAA